MLNTFVTIGMNARLFPNNWRPALKEIGFAKNAGFHAIQFQGKEAGLNEETVGCPFSKLSNALRESQITPVMEILIHVDKTGKTTSGKSPLEILQANIHAISRLNCTHVHWHLAPSSPITTDESFLLETSYISQLQKAVELAKDHGFNF